MAADPVPQWLTDEERAAWLSLAGVMIRLPAALDAQLKRDAGITHFEYLVMARLSETDGRTMRISDLASIVEGSLPRLSQVVTRLENQGWVCRTPDPSDGRYTRATLTDDGWKKVVATAPGHVTEVRRLAIDSLTKAQLRQLTTIGQRIIRAINPDHDC